MDNTPPFDDAGLFARLDELGLTHKTVEHEALFTVEQSRALRGNLDGAHIKNLFLRDKKRRMWLVTVLENREMDLKALRHRIGAQGNLSFGNADLLMQHLGIIPGAVTPFSVNAHPLRNDRTTAISPGDLMAFLEAENHAPLVLNFDEE
ncbi:MAG: prolyl-tRNA synthetase associated domain-containing protein [Alphaproteobacteria bacterium]|nr:prolyl-tRNA synthetase associated domain-containing protein [Alphaproteobacteria bacterium]